MRTRSKEDLYLRLYLIILSLLFYRELIFFSNSFFKSQIAIIDFCIACGMLLFGLIVYYRSRNKKVTNHFAVLCFQITLIFIFFVSTDPLISQIGACLLCFLPLNLYNFFSRFLQVPSKKSILILSACLGFACSVMFVVGIEPYFALSLLLLSSVLFCVSSYLQMKKRKIHFLRQFRRLLMISVVLSIAPFLIFWNLPRLVGFYNIHLYYSVLSILILPSAITYILLKNNAFSRPFSIVAFIRKNISIAILFLIIFGFLTFLRIDNKYAVPIFFVSFIVCTATDLLNIYIDERGKSPLYRRRINAFAEEKRELVSEWIWTPFYEDWADLFLAVLETAAPISQILLVFQDRKNFLTRVLSGNMELEIRTKIMSKMSLFAEKPQSVSMEGKYYLILPLIKPDSDQNLYWIVLGNSGMEPYSENQILDLQKILPKISDAVHSAERIYEGFVTLSEQKKNDSVTSRHSDNISAVVFREKKIFRNYLHDDILQTVLSVKMMADSCSVPEKVMAGFDILIAKIRDTIFEVLPPALYYLNMYQNLALLVDNFNEKSSMLERDFCPIFLLECPKNFTIQKVEIAESIYRIVKELNDNALNHSEATRVINQISLTSSHLLISVIDNGIGIVHNYLREETDRETKVGLLSVKYDVSLLGGEMNILSENYHNGTQISITFPIEVTK